MTEDEVTFWLAVSQETLADVWDNEGGRHLCRITRNDIDSVAEGDEDNSPG